MMSGSTRPPERDPESTATTQPAATPSQPSAPSLTAEERRLFDLFAGFDLSELDWPAFKGTYKGRALLTRLTYIGLLLRLPSSTTPPLALLQIIKQASSDAVEIITSQTLDRDSYARHLTTLDVLDLYLKGLSDPNAPTPRLVDISALVGPHAVPGWYETAEEQLRKESTRLDVELKGYMSNLIKESIRLTYLALAELSFKAGSYQGALKNYAAAREYSSSPQHHLDLGLGILDACLAYNAVNSLPGHITKLEGALNRLHPPSDTSKPTVRPGAAELASMTAGDVRENEERAAQGAETRRVVTNKINVAQGVIALGRGSYAEAGRLMGRVLEDGGLGEWEGLAISTADVCLISGLCILATGRREQITDTLLDRTSFRTSLDDSQGWLLDLIRAYMNAQYGEVKAIYNRVEPILALNMWTAPHVRILRRKIVERSIVQYVEPFSTVKLETMASAFNISENDMSGQVERLIWAGSIKGRIDLVDKVLEVKAPDARRSLVNNALKTGSETISSTQAALFRMRLHEAGISVNPPRQAGGEGEDALAWGHTRTHAEPATSGGSGSGSGSGSGTGGAGQVLGGEPGGTTAAPGKGSFLDRLVSGLAA